VKVLLALVGTAVLVARLDLVRVPDDTLFWNRAFDAGHAPLFGVIALLFLWVARGREGLQRRGASVPYLVAFGAAVVVGVASEAVQFFAPRDSDPVDLVRNAVGAAAFLVFVGTMDAALRQRLGGLARLALRAVCLLAIVAVFLPVVTIGVVYAQRARAMPVVCDLDANWSGALIELVNAELTFDSPPPGWNASGQVARLVLYPARHPRIQIEEPYPDWSEHRRLRFELFLDGPHPQKLTLRIHDGHHDHRRGDRFNRKLRLQPGFTAIEVELDDVRTAPRKREMDMRLIRSVQLYATDPTEPVRFYLSDLRLE
jgi:hypothetical protein